MEPLIPVPCCALRPARPAIRLAMLAAIAGLAACQTAGGSFCAVAKPIRLSQPALEKLGDGEIERLLAFNEKGEKLCGWKP
jgi:hypothetical protein